MKSQNILMNATGFVFLGDSAIYQAVRFQLQIGFEKIDVALRTGTYVIPVSQPMRVLLSMQGLNVELLSKLTGGTVTAGAKRWIEEVLTKATNQLTLTQTPVGLDAPVVQPFGTNVAPLIKVASSPGLGEFSISGTTITLNASQPETQFKVSYLYDDATNGDMLQIDPDDLPGTLSCFGIVPLKEIHADKSGFLVAELAKIQRDSALNLGNEISAANPLEGEFNVINAIPGDVKLHVFAE